MDAGHTCRYFRELRRYRILIQLQEIYFSTGTPR